jgi:hypothetical protein
MSFCLKFLTFKNILKLHFQNKERICTQSRHRSLYRYHTNSQSLSAISHGYTAMTNQSLTRKSNQVCVKRRNLLDSCRRFKLDRCVLCRRKKMGNLTACNETPKKGRGRGRKETAVASSPIPSFLPIQPSRRPGGAHASSLACRAPALPLPSISVPKKTKLN